MFAGVLSLVASIFPVTLAAIFSVMSRPERDDEQERAGTGQTGDPGGGAEPGGDDLHQVWLPHPRQGYEG